MTDFKITDKLTYKRKEIMALLRLDGRVLDYWENEFQAVFPVVNQNGDKFYSRQDLEVLLRIKQLLLVEKKSKQEIRELLEQTGSGKNVLGCNSEKNTRKSAEKKARIRELIAEILTIIDKSDKQK